MASTTISCDGYYNGTHRIVSATVSSDYGSTSASYTLTSTYDTSQGPYTRVGLYINGSLVYDSGYSGNFNTFPTGRNKSFSGTANNIPASGIVSISLGVGIGHNNLSDATASGSIVKATTPTINAPSVSPSRTIASASFSVANNGGVAITDHYIDCSQSNFGSVVSSIASSSGTFSGLTPNTTYYARANASNGYYRGYSSVVSFTTTGNAPTVNSVAVSPSRTSAIFNPNVSYDTNASFRSYSIRYGTSTSYGSTSTSTTISGLTPNTTYYYSVTVTDNWGRTSTAKTGSFKTTGNNPTINSHEVKVYAQTSVEMQYSASYDTNDSLSSYKWEYGTSTSYGSSITGTNIINGLNANTTYYYKLTVTSVQGRSSTATGSFKTDPATVTISALGISEITETTVKVDYTFSNPSNVEQFYVIETVLEREDGTSQNYQANNITLPYTKVYDNLEPGSKYTCKTRVGIKGQSGTVYYSQWASQDFETLASTPFVKIDSNGVIKHYKGYALGKSDIYNGYSSEWKNGNYSETVNSPISFNGEGAGVSKVKYIEIMPNDTYTYEFPVEQFTTSSGITLILTNVSDIIQKVVKVTPGQSGSINTDSSTRLYITCTGTDLNKETARYVRFSIYRSISKVPLDKESIVTLNNKIRYIDISQNGYIKGTTTGSDGKIIELDVYDKLGNNIALNKNVTMERGSGSNLEKITDGNHDGSSYCTLNENSAGTTVRVDLGQEYSYDQIDRVVLWRDVDCLYQESRLLGLDASKQITWKFQSYKSEGVYKETSEGYTARPRKAKTKHNIYITSLLNELDNPPFADKITINADWNISIPPVIADLTTHRVDAIIAANSGRLLKNDVGDLTALTTTEKSNLVDAINEIWNSINKTEEEFTVLDFVLESILCG